MFLLYDAGLICNSRTENRLKWFLIRHVLHVISVYTTGVLLICVKFISNTFKNLKTASNYISLAINITDALLVCLNPKSNTFKNRMAASNYINFIIWYHWCITIVCLKSKSHTLKNPRLLIITYILSFYTTGIKQLLICVKSQSNTFKNIKAASNEIN